MHNLIERLDRPYGRSPMTEAISGERIRLTRDDLPGFFQMLDDNPSAHGTFVSLSYASVQKVYKTKKNWRPDDVTAALNAHREEHGESDWFKGLDTYNKPETKGKSPISTVIVCLRRIINYQSKANFDKDRSEYMNGLDDLRLSVGLPQKFRDPTSSETTNGWGTQTHLGTQVKQFNKKKAKTISSDSYLIGDDGKLICIIPSDVINSISAPFKHDYEPENDAVAMLENNPEALEAYKNGRKELCAKFGYGQFNFDQIISFAAGFEGKSYYFVNDNLTMSSSSSKGVVIDPSEWEKIGFEQLKENFKEADEGPNSTEKEHYV